MPHDPRFGSGPDALHPLPDHPRVTFLRNLDLPPNVEVGAYTYYDDPAGPQAFLDNILYHFAFLGDCLRIGRFCALASGTRFLMNGGNHRLEAPSTDPFAIFRGDWTGHFPEEIDFPNRGDTIIGHDVWLGYDCTILPGVTVGTGTVVAAKSVVTRDVPPYAIVAGNPATVVGMRVPPEVAERLLAVAWWDWTPERITRCLSAISGGDVEALEAEGHEFRPTDEPSSPSERVVSGRPAGFSRRCDDGLGFPSTQDHDERISVSLPERLGEQAKSAAHLLLQSVLRDFSAQQTGQ